MLQPLRIHLDTFDLGHLAKSYRKDTSVLSLPVRLAQAGAEFLISPTTYQEALNSAKGREGVRYTAPILRVLDELSVAQHAAPHAVIAAELFPHVKDRPRSLSKFEKQHLSREVESFLRRELPRSEKWEISAIVPLLSKALKLTSIESANMSALLQELAALDCREASKVRTPQEQHRALCESVAELRGVFEITGAQFETEILSFDPSVGPERLMGGLALRTRIHSIKTAPPRYAAKGEGRYRDIINEMLRGWGYVFEEELPTSLVAQTLPSLRCHAAYWSTRNPGEDMSFNNLCDALQLLYLPQVALFSVDTKVFRDVGRAIPTDFRSRMHPKGEFWPVAARALGVSEGLDKVVAAYR